jgi:hypothetical protein
MEQLQSGTTVRSFLVNELLCWRPGAPYLTATNIKQLDNGVTPFPQGIIDKGKRPAHRTVLIYERELLSTDFSRSGRLCLSRCWTHVTREESAQQASGKRQN